MPQPILLAFFKTLPVKTHHLTVVFKLKILKMHQGSNKKKLRTDTCSKY